MPQLTYRLTSTKRRGYRVSFEAWNRLDLAAAATRPPHQDLLALGNRHHAADRWPDTGGDIEPPGGFEDALKAFKEAFTQWREGIADDKWRENLEYKRAGQERWRRINWDADFAGFVVAGRNDAMPTDTVTWPRGSPLDFFFNGLETMLFRIASATLLAPAAVALGRTTANSSPPYRAARSCPLMC